MSDTAIRVENLSKFYRIGRAQQRHDTPSTGLRTGLRDALTATLQRFRLPIFPRSNNDKKICVHLC
jgi:hypothetical protein